MHPRALLWILLAAAAGLGGAYLALRESGAEVSAGATPPTGGQPSAERAPAPAFRWEPQVEPVPPLPIPTDRKSEKPLHVKSPWPPGTRIPVSRLPKVEPGKGIGFFDGTWLPYLNGLNAAPPATRDPDLGRVPPVIAKVVDADGLEWWVHADGSATTTRYKQVTALGQTYWDPATEHSAVQPNTNLRSTPETPPDRKDR